jgi:hypothetical protein
VVLVWALGGVFIIVGICAFVYELYGVIKFGRSFSIQYDVSRIYAYACLAPFFLVSFVAELIGDSTGFNFSRFKRKAKYLAAISGAIFVDLLWTLGIGGLLTGPQELYVRSNGQGVDIPSLANPGIAAMIGAVVGLPLAIRWAWSDLPRSVARQRAKSRYEPPIKTNYERLRSNTAFEAQTDSKMPGRAENVVITIASAFKSSLENHIWIGALIGLGTLCGIAAGWSGNLTLLHLVLASIASAIAGTLGALQWRSKLRGYRRL